MCLGEGSEGHYDKNIRYDVGLVVYIFWGLGG